MCEKGKEDNKFTTADFVKANGVTVGEILCRECEKGIKCTKHGTHVIFIDLTHVCAECITFRALQIIKEQWFDSFYKVITEALGNWGKAEHDELVRVTTGESKLTDKECLAVSFETFCSRKELKYQEAIIVIIARLMQYEMSLVDAILPSSTHK